MKSSTSKPISSPGRADKYPPPLMRFLRSNVGSKSRSRSRATPLFTRRKKSTIDAHQQEPSSPKVTCIGQVRVRRSSSKSKQMGPRNREPPPLKRRPSTNTGVGNWFCFWVGKPPSICCSFRFSLCFRRKRSFFRPIWRKWFSFFCCRSIRVRTDSSKKWSNPTGSGQIYSDSTDSYDIRRHRFENREEEFDEDGEETEVEDEEFSARESSGRVNGSHGSTSPPKNALLLTRCRSAPQRSSYLASQFWGSPLKSEEEEEHKVKTEEQENRETIADEAVEKVGSSGSEKIQRDSAVESRIDREGEGNLEICKKEAEFVGCSNNAETTIKTPTTQKKGKEEEEEEVLPKKEEGEERIVVLTRCKSEPARSSGDPLSSSFWRERMLESTVSCRNSVETK